MDIVVIRINAKGELRNARPCHNCLAMMKSVGIRKVHYSINDDIICEKVNKMISIQASSVRMMLDRAYKNAPKNNKDYFLELLDKLFPECVTEFNVNLFIKYNLNNVLPCCTSCMKNIKGNRFILIISSSGGILKKARII